MIPLKDDIPPRRTPGVNYVLIAACSFVFFLQLSGARGLVERYGMVPARLTGDGAPIERVEERIVRTERGPIRQRVSRTLPEAAVAPALTLLTCMFLHGGWLHFLGNMWFLHIFGDNVEDRFGHLGFLAFYLAAGVAASVAHLLANPDSTVPTIGASGAIAGVMGAYLLLYPRAMVLTLIPIFFFVDIVVLPAALFLGVWFLLQFFQGVLAVGAAATGVAWWAHIGGFAAGLAVAWALRESGTLAPPVRQRSGPHR